MSRERLRLNGLPRRKSAQCRSACATGKLVHSWGSLPVDDADKLPRAAGGRMKRDFFCARSPISVVLVAIVPAGSAAH